MPATFFQSWWFQNLLTLGLLTGAALLAWRLSRREYWRNAFHEICRNRLAVISFIILCGYGAIAILDSVGWRRPLRHPETGEVARHPETGKVILDQGASALDYLLAPISAKREKTYSAPLAATDYTPTTAMSSTGQPQRVHAPLTYPRSHLFGTDRIGQDVFCQACKSIRTGIIIGLLTTILAVPFALVFGTAAGYYGGWIDDATQYVCAVLSSIPTVLFIAAFMIIFGQGLPQLALAMGIASWTGLCRLLRGETIRLRETDFVLAAKAMGVPSWRIILRHIVPNVLHLILITTVIRFSSEVLAEAAFTYLGIGVGADTMSWGAMINDARTELTREPIIWWKLAAAFTFMVGLVLPANLFGDAVRDALDPRLR
ncbi:MAG: ABC transporter permease [Lentisphaerae bacterium]|nr:ABC transporter permease [Lentisphaerota bacterium]OQC16363.1 MAG: Oligopeptide transport system permease protein OppC [Lentisphaerae bacterium ADurb.Bin082]